MASPYDKIIEMIKKLDLRDDGIVMNHKIKSIENDFCNIVRDEIMLSDSMDYINDEVLSDGDASLKFALLFSSRNFDSLAMNETKVRSKMLRILENNFIKAEDFRKDDKNRLFNLITLHGEYYHRVRLAHNKPISILGESLLALLTQEIKGDDQIDVKLAKLILSQITLNGAIMRTLHKTELNLLLFHVRRNMIEQPNMMPAVKAILLMTLDLYYSNFSNIDHMLEEMYTKYLVEEEEEEEIKEDDVPEVSLEEVGIENSFDLYESETHIPWTQQIIEELMNKEKERENSISNQHNEDNQQQQSDQLQNNEPTSNEENEMHGDNNFNEIPEQTQWRNKRFLRNIHDQNNERRDFSNKNNATQSNNRRNRRFSGGNFDDDRQSVRSEGGSGSSRFYCVNDRLASNNKSDRQNWDRGVGSFQNYDRYNQRNGSRNSMNFDNYNENNGGGGRGHYNNRNTFDRPPRFRNNDKFRNSGESFRNNDPSWRNGQNSDRNYSRGGSRGPESESRSSSRNRNNPNLPRNNEDYNGHSHSPDDRNDFQKEYTNRKGGSDGSFNNYRNSGMRPQTSHNHNRNNQQRYSSQNSLTSESSTWDRRNNRRNNRAQSQDWDETRSLQGQPDENSWNIKDNNSELVKNAQNTTKYMQYLSEK